MLHIRLRLEQNDKFEHLWTMLEQTIELASSFNNIFITVSVTLSHSCYIAIDLDPDAIHFRVYY